MPVATSVTEQVIAAAVSVITAAAGVGGRVYRDRNEAFARTETPAVLIEPASMPADDRHSNCRTAWTLLLRVVIIVRGGSVSLLADPIRVAIHHALMTNATLDGLAMALRPARSVPAVDWDHDPGDNMPGLCILSYEIEHRSLTVDLTIP
jgi:hypothetical protein